MDDNKIRKDINNKIEDMFDPDLVLETSCIMVRILVKEDMAALTKLTGDNSIWKFFPSDLLDEKALQFLKKEWTDIKSSIFSNTI